MKSEKMRLEHEKSSMLHKIKDNTEKIKLNKQLPYLVSNIVEILQVDAEDDDEPSKGEKGDVKKEQCAVIKTTTRQTVFLPMIGLVEKEKLKPGDLVGVNKDSFLILDVLPAEYVSFFPFSSHLFLPSPTHSTTRSFLLSLLSCSIGSFHSLVDTILV